MRILNFLENLVDPYVSYPENDTPSSDLGTFLWSFMYPFRKVMALNVTTSFATAGAEVFLIFYLGRLIDLMAGSSPIEFWGDHGVELALVLVFILVLRPIIQTLDTALIKNAIQPNLAALGRWRAHRHVLR